MSTIKYFEYKTVEIENQLFQFLFDLDGAQGAAAVSQLQEALGNNECGGVKISSGNYTEDGPRTALYLSLKGACERVEKGEVPVPFQAMNLLMGLPRTEEGDSSLFIISDDTRIFVAVFDHYLRGDNIENAYDIVFVGDLEQKEFLVHPLLRVLGKADPLIQKHVQEAHPYLKTFLQRLERGAIESSAISTKFLAPNLPLNLPLIQSSGPACTK